jgi:hypothetical protein
MAVLRTRTLTPTDPACYVVQTSVGTFLDLTGHFAGLDRALLLTKDGAAYAMRDAYRAMVHYIPLSAVHLPASPFRKYFYPE